MDDHSSRVAEEFSGYVTIKPYSKSKASRRSLPLPQFVVQLLTEHIGRFGKDDDSLVFTTRTGEAIRRGTLRSRVWKPSLHRAGLPAALRFHDIRHSYGAWLAVGRGSTTWPR